jgi:RNA polymerase sigma-70 factor (ECF subfamily)
VVDREHSRADESVIVAALAAGDKAVFRQIVTELTPGLTRMARTYVRPALADEVVQETWMAVIRSIRQFEQRSSLKTWIYRIMLNKVRTLATREAKIVPFTSVGPSAESDAPSVAADRLVHPDLGNGYWPEAPVRWDTLPATVLESREVREQIQAGIAALPAAQREVVTLRDVDGWSADEVCETLGISAVNQRVLLHRARASLRARLEGSLQ